MAIINRSLDISQQKETLHKEFNFISAGVSLSIGAVFPALSTGQSSVVVMIPYNCTLKSAIVAATGLSGSPALNFNVERFIVGTGDTLIGNILSTLALTAFGTSGYQSVSLPAAGSSLLQLLTGDLVHMSVTGSNSAVAECVVDLVVAAINDVKQIFGSSV